jgi:hypothetical protein
MSRSTEMEAFREHCMELLKDLTDEISTGASAEESSQQLANTTHDSSTLNISNRLHERLSGWSNIFSEEIPITPFEEDVARRLRPLGQARLTLTSNTPLNTRLYLVSLHHEIQYISQCPEIQDYTGRGVESMSAAIKLATKFLAPAAPDYKRSKNMVHIMREGGPASILEQWGILQSMYALYIFS